MSRLYSMLYQKDQISVVTVKFVGKNPHQGTLFSKSTPKTAKMDRYYGYRIPHR